MSIYDAESVIRKHAELVTDLETYQTFCKQANKSDDVTLGWMAFDMYIAAIAILQLLNASQATWQESQDSAKILLAIDGNFRRFKYHDCMNIGEKIMYNGIAESLQVILDEYQKEKQS